MQTRCGWRLLTPVFKITRPFTTSSFECQFYVIFTAENSKHKMNTILSKKTNIEQKRRKNMQIKINSKPAPKKSISKKTFKLEK